MLYEVHVRAAIFPVKNYEAPMVTVISDMVLLSQVGKRQNVGQCLRMIPYSLPEFTSFSLLGEKHGSTVALQTSWVRSLANVS
jgi:hypothetical protein